MSIDRLCFGTSTFAAGRLRPDKDSGPGIGTLRKALHLGLDRIHSNPRLRTQWAIREAVGARSVHHLIKAEAPLDADLAYRRQRILGAIEQSREQLNAERVHTLVLELDLKHTGRHHLLVDDRAVRSFYASGAAIALESGTVDHVVAYCHSPAHLLTALGCPQLAGVSAQYNVAEPWAALYLDQLQVPFIGMAPLRRGALGLDGVRWAAAHPAVKSLVVTMSTVRHLHEVIEAVSDPLPRSAVRETARSWLAAVP